ncbi:MBL fold metallo-hydrolase [Pararhizobium sp. PWRC1-1]|uniref:MBL fold metallo-hydrolase n=1 Tax=Pararhizobium sp. PWRC1-1 TaxID=2804566 RepID=UPI003CEA7233
MEDICRVTFWGVRGSLPVSGEEFLAFGGRTACIQIRCGTTDLIFDAGTGIQKAGDKLIAEGVENYHLFFSHSHYDHILGLPFFQPLYRRSSKVDIWTGHLHGAMTPREMVEAFISPPWFPQKIEICQARLSFHDFAPGETLKPADGIEITTASLNHPGGCVGYRIGFRGRVIALVYDLEHQPGVLDPTALKLMADADLAVYDSAYLDDEIEAFKGFGHSTWQQGVRLAKAANAKKIAFFHHMPIRTDQALTTIEKKAMNVFDGSFVARDDMMIDVSAE